MLRENKNSFLTFVSCRRLRIDVKIQCQLISSSFFTIVGDTPLGRQLSKRKKKNEPAMVSPPHKPNPRKYSVDNIDLKYEKQKDKSNRAKLTKGGSLDDPTMGRENKEVPSDLVMKRGGSVKGRTRKESKDHGEERTKQRKERKLSTDSSKGSSSKHREYKFEEMKKHVVDVPTTNLDSTGTILSLQTIITMYSSGSR